MINVIYFCCIANKTGLSNGNWLDTPRAHVNLCLVLYFLLASINLFMADASKALNIVALSRQLNSSFSLKYGLFLAV